MFDSPKEKSEKAKAFKKLMSKWLSVQATERKATLLLSKNPELKLPTPVKKRKSPSI
jgi:hypothetical protein